jgi:hypothetical protein
LRKGFVAAAFAEIDAVVVRSARVYDTISSVVNRPLTFSHGHLASVREHRRVHAEFGVTRCQRAGWKWMMNGGSSLM